jgi:hypothetical protein
MNKHIVEYQQYGDEKQRGGLVKKSQQGVKIFFSKRPFVFFRHEKIRHE